MKRTENFPEMMTIQEVATLLNVTYHTVFKWIQNGELHAVRVGPKVWRVPSVSYVEFLKTCGSKSR